ncbi:hypothetical protein CW357_08330 [Rummeliibacillus sp. TYF005]|uniref:DUF2231 domain-containing protein n=1 Tax=Rummeliibacillus sp. TYF005 TaxID=2058214 RepID=UPI000F52C2E3|nr:DUF2231 domain-containing protein [Rummeliibacillus sp. TYF005]RPJ95873.1 hypothetical protein CW357_08330 [Rummeliibacillus sp. TYF005]
MPLHPLVVHFPIALLILAGVIEIVNVFMKKELLNKFGTLLLILGLISGFVALATEDGAEHFAESKWGDAVKSQIEPHENFADISMIIFSVLTVIKILFRHNIFKFSFLQSKVLRGGITSVLIVLLSLGGIAALAVTGHLGGKIVYENNSNTSVDYSNSLDEYSDE